MKVAFETFSGRIFRRSTSAHVHVGNPCGTCALHPAEDYSAGNFYDDGRQAIKDILSRGHVPIFTGGTGLYLRWFIYRKPNVPKATPEITLELQLLNLYLPTIGIDYIIMNLFEKPLVRISNSWPTLGIYMLVLYMEVKKACNL
ncbi:unnamed protein product [Lactuca saligna]|uniref:Uncharacterized protein n=1 Tax=Lactuca saligna TaxID=75948 RepID=A0AA35VB48_LACSI|nr:unnamed protein product [Lactuca saligna]